MADRFSVITDLLESSASLAGLALVFLGMIATATAEDAPRKGISVAANARRPVYSILVAFFAGILCVGAAALWLVAFRSTYALYILTVVLFFVQLLSLVSATTWSIRQVLRH